MSLGHEVSSQKNQKHSNEKKQVEKLSIDIFNGPVLVYVFDLTTFE